MIDWIIDRSLANRLLTGLAVALVSIWGVMAYTRMPKDIYPDLNAPLVNIITEHPGMPAEDVEQLITRPLESLMSGTPRVTRVRSESTTGDSVVTVEFEWGTDIYLARQIVASKLQLIAGRLPAGTSSPLLGAVSSRMGEVFEFAVTGDEVSPMELRSIADWTIRYSLQGVPGVAFVVNLGGFVRQYQVLLKPEMLKHYGITVREVKEAIEDSNRNFAGGVLIRGPQETLIKGLGRIESVEHVAGTVITSRDNVPVFVRDVADVQVGEQFRRGSASHNGREAVYVTVEKQYGGDTLAAIAHVKTVLARVARDLPEGVSLKPFYDQSALIVRSIGHVERSLIEGAVLVVVVMLIFMGGLRTSLIASLTMPFSILAALVLLHVVGVKLTVMSIGGLAIGVGKVANGSIIMVENIDRLLRERRGQGSTLVLTSAAAREVGSFFEHMEGPQTIFREGLMRRKTILCNVEGRDVGRLVEEAQKAIAQRVDLPAGYHVSFGGQFESQVRAMRQLSTIMVVVVLVIFVVLLTSFGRALEAVVIILSIPLTLVGGVVALVVAGETLNVSSIIGLIALFGVGIQNDIILVGKIGELWRAGRPLAEAVVVGSLTKFRAILLTNLVMIVAVLPLALGMATGAELHRPLAVVYVGGFSLAIVLKMITVPVLFQLLAAMREKLVPER